MFLDASEFETSWKRDWAQFPVPLVLKTNRKRSLLTSSKQRPNALLFENEKEVSRGGWRRRERGKGERWMVKRDGGGKKKKKRKENNKHTEVEWWSSSECFVCSPREVGVAVSMPFKIIICNLPEYTHVFIVV